VTRSSIRLVHLIFMVALPLSAHQTIHSDNKFFITPRPGTRACEAVSSIIITNQKRSFRRCLASRYISTHPSSLSPTPLLYNPTHVQSQVELVTSRHIPPVILHLGCSDRAMPQPTRKRARTKAAPKDGVAEEQQSTVFTDRRTSWLVKCVHLPRFRTS
jgi:hypothetical protein